MAGITTDVLQGPRLKVQRANRHIDDIIQRSSPLDRELYDIRSVGHYTLAVQAQPDAFDLTFWPKQPIAKSFALVIGDAVHNLRAALDHLATGIVQATRPGAAKLTFPFHEEGKDLETHPALKAIEKALPGSGRLIVDEIKPDSSNREFWGITKLDNIDKHNFILPAVTVGEVKNINSTDGRMRNCGAGNNADNPFVLVRSGSPFPIQQDYYTSVNISFGHGSLFENQPVIPTLSQMSDLVRKAIDCFGRLIAR